jgi:hypothetical protein
MHLFVNEPTSVFRRLLLVYAALALSTAAVLGTSSNSADAIASKAIANWAEAESRPKEYQYTRFKLRTETDLDGKINKRQERVYHITPIHGEPFPRLVRKEGQPLTPEELERENQREQQFRENPGQEKTKKEVERKQMIVDGDLIRKLEFKLVGREQINGRSTLVLAFKPKPNYTVKSLEDRVINKIVGKVWVDEDELEMAKLHLWLTDKVTLGFGLIGAMYQFQFNLDRIRMEDGSWLQQESDGVVEYRQLLNSKRVRWKERWTDFQKTLHDQVSN